MLLITHGLPTSDGYLELDNRASGIAPAGLPLHFECDTYTCSHCSTVVLLRHDRMRPRYKCNKCNHHVCDDCAGDLMEGKLCKTMQQQIDEYLEAVVRQNGDTSSPIILP